MLKTRSGAIVGTARHQHLERPQTERGPPHLRLLTQRQVLDKLGVGKSYLYAGMKLGIFPRPIQPDPNSKAVRWLEHELDAVIAARIAARDEMLEKKSAPAVDALKEGA
jgi:predicted DNA-binding transcriptional regulator AlpA